MLNRLRAFGRFLRQPQPVRQPPSSRPSLERLEDRCIPSATALAQPIAGQGIPYWDSGEQHNLALIQQGHADVLFLGDSILAGMADGVGKPVWDGDFAPLHAV